LGPLQHYPAIGMGYNCYNCQKYLWVYGLWVTVTKSPHPSLRNSKWYVLLESMGYTWYPLGGSLLYRTSIQLTPTLPESNPSPCRLLLTSPHESLLIGRKTRTPWAWRAIRGERRNMQLGRTLGKCCDPKQGRGVTQLKCQRQ
jgi:hypothetical protein